MTQEEFDLILQEGEGYKIEFKEILSTSISKEISAFANASGGRIFIGVRDNNTVCGIDINNELKTRIQDIANACDEPVEVYFESFNNVLIVNVKEGRSKPHSCTNGYYLRVGPISQKLEHREILEFIRSEGRIKFDELRKFEAKFPEDYKPELLNTYLHLAEISKTLDDTSILQNLGVLDYEKNTFVFLNAGILFFSRYPSRFFPHSSIVCAVYETNEKINIIDRKEFTSDIISNIEQALSFIKNNMKIKIEIEGSRREEKPEIPLVVFREAVVNAVTHRDYFEKGANVMIELFSDRIEISNPGGLPKGLSREDFGKRSLCRNPVIASLLQRVKYIERMGTGISRMKSVMLNAGLPEPIFNFDSFFTVILKRKDILLSFSKTFKIKSPQSDRIVMILLMLYKQEPLVIQQIADEYKVDARTIRNDIKKLILLELVEGIGKTKEKEYKITPKGEIFVAANI